MSAPPNRDQVGSLEHCVHVPRHRIARWAVRGQVGDVDDRPGPVVELLPVSEVGSQSWADMEPVAGIDTEVATVEEGVDVRAQQQAVVDPVLAAEATADRTDVSGLQSWGDATAGDGAASVVGSLDERLERLLTDPRFHQVGEAIDRS